MDQIGQFIINHWGLCVLLVSILILIFINERLVQKMRAKELSPQVAVALLNDDKAIVIDLRDKELYRKGHIINAIHASKEDFEQHRMDKYKTNALILVCARGTESTALASKLRAAGFSEPMVLAGGITAWQSSDLPLVKGK